MWLPLIINDHLPLELINSNYMHCNYAMLFIYSMLCDGTCSNHVDVEGKQVQVECQVELHSIERYNNNIHQHSIYRLPIRIFCSISGTAAIFTFWVYC